MPRRALLVGGEVIPRERLNIEGHSGILHTRHVYILRYVLVRSQVLSLALRHG